MLLIFVAQILCFVHCFIIWGMVAYFIAILQCNITKKNLTYS